MSDLQDENSEAKKFGRYTIIELLATGGMARIFKARTTHENVLTLKKILPEYSTNPDFIKMFLEEAKISLNLKHPNVVRVVDFGQIEGSYYLAMEYVFGRDLGSMLRTCAEKRVYIPVDVACLIILQCCRGLDYAHSLTDSFGTSMGLVHRDISPPNVLLSYNGEAKILDFGIAKAVKGAGRRNTRSGVLKGKFSYMSPEQASGEPLDHQSDLFSLGIVFYELLTSRSLFYSDDEIETLERVRKAKVEPPSKFRKDLPKELDRIVLKALTLKKKNRFQTCSEFADAIRGFLKEEYPRSDARTVAKFVRSCFFEDYQKRSKVTLTEGWKDILAVGAADDEILLDRTFSEQDSLSTRPRDDDISWLQRMLYDPKTSAKLGRNIRIALLAIALLGLGIFFLKSNTVSTSWNAIQKWNQTAPATTASSIPPSSVSKPSEAPEGSFSDWVSRGALAEKTDPHAALKFYLRALSINPFERAVLVRKNFMLLATGSFDESCRWFRDQKDLNLEDRLLSDAACAEIQGENQRASDFYASFLQKFSNDTRATEVRKILDYLKKEDSMKSYFIYSLIFISSIAIFIACGSGDYTIDPEAGDRSQVGDTTSGGTTGGGTTAGTTTGATPQQYFTDNLWPLMKLTSGKGCASGGCHNLQTPQTFYQVDPSSASNSWNWASVRRKSVDTSTGYARSSSVTIRARKNSNHNSFQNWTSTDKALIDAWVALP